MQITCRFQSGIFDIIKVNTNCMILAKNAPKIPVQNFTALTHLDYNRFVAEVSDIRIEGRKAI